jgi:undecaprenyl-diphosphatase
MNTLPERCDINIRLWRSQWILLSMTPWLQRLDARDRAMFSRLCLSPACREGTRAFWSFITHLGGARASIGLCLAALVFPSVHWTQVWATLLLLGWSHLAVQVVKRTVGRPRPRLTEGLESLIEIPDRFSFPSGHSCAAMAVAIGFSTAFPTLAVPLLILAMLVGFSRVMLGVHYPGDVVVGQAIALLTAYPLLS